MVQKNHSTQDSRVVPHRGTNWAAPWLTSQIRRDAVLSRSYGRGYYERFVAAYKPIFLDHGVGFRTVEFDWSHYSYLPTLSNSSFLLSFHPDQMMEKTGDLSCTRITEKDEGLCP